MPELYNVRLNDGGLDMDRLRQNDDEEQNNQFSPNALLQQQDDPEVAYFKCGWCGFAHPKERTVRAHITREDEGKHKNKNGFLDVFVQACDDDGDVIGDMEAPKTMSLGGEVTDEYLPMSVERGTKGAKILKTAIENPQMAEKDIAQEVYDDPTQSNISYVYSTINQYLSQDAVEEGNVESDTGSGDQPLYTTTRRGMTADPDADSDITDWHTQGTEKSYEDLKPKQQVLINEHVRNEVDNLNRARTDIEGLADVSTGYGKKVLDKYDQIVEERREQYENGEIELPKPGDILGDTSTPDKSYADLSPLQQRVIDHWVQNPDQNKGDIEHKANASPGYSARLYRKYEDIRDRRRDAYENGVLTNEHLNTPARDEFIKDTSVPEKEQEEIPQSEQPRGTPIEDADTGASAESTDTQQPTVDMDAVATPEDIESVREEVSSLQDSVASQLATTTERVGELERRAQELETALDDIEPTGDSEVPEELTNIEARVEQLERTVEDAADKPVEADSIEAAASEATEVTTTADEQETPEMITPITAEDIGRDGVSDVTLDQAQVTEVVKALSTHLPEENNDILQKVVVQA